MMFRESQLIVKIAIEMSLKELVKYAHTIHLICLLEIKLI
jgi:hypothetical protein